MQECARCGASGKFRGELCRPCRRKERNGDVSGPELFGEDTSPGMRVGTNAGLWRVVYVITAIPWIWMGRAAAQHVAYVGIPVALLVMASTVEIVAAKRFGIPIGLRRSAESALPIIGRIQMATFMMVMGLAFGHGLVLVGLDRYLSNPLNVLENPSKLVERETVNEFPHKIPGIDKELTMIGALIDSNHAQMAQQRLQDLDGSMVAILNSYARNYADVVAVQQRIVAMHGRFKAHQQAIAVNEALTKIGSAALKLDQIDGLVARARWDLASHAWVKAQKEIEDIDAPELVVSDQMTSVKARLEAQRLQIRNGFQGNVTPPAVAKRDTKKHASRTTHRAMYTLDP